MDIFLLYSQFKLKSKQKQIYAFAVFLFLISRILLANGANTDWPGGYFYDSAAKKCQQCDPTWYSCEDKSSWAGCYENARVDPGSGLWVNCPQGTFYSSSLSSWIDWNGSCLDKCAYQSECHACPDGKVLDLSSLAWVDECDSSNQVLMDDPRFAIRPFWRDLEYFVNSESQSSMELGTKQYPYKSIEEVFVEVFNHHSNSNRSISINVMENTRNYIQLNKQYVFNLTVLKIVPYSDTNPTPSKSTLVGIENGEKCLLPSTMFNILLSWDLKINTIINENKEIGERAKSNLVAMSAIFTIYKSSFIIDNMNLESEYEFTHIGYSFMLPVMFEEKRLVLTNVNIGISGNILRTLDHLDAHFENLYIDSYR